MSLSEKPSVLKDDYTVDRDNEDIGQTFQVNQFNIKQTKRHLLPRHIQLIAISGAIGTGLFVSAFDKSGIGHVLTILDWYWFCAAQSWSSCSTPRLCCLWRSCLYCLQLNGRDGVVSAY